MENYIESGIISPGGISLFEANGQSLESVLRVGEVIEVFTNEFGDKQHLSITSISGDTIMFMPSFVGNIDQTPIYGRKKRIVCADASSA